MHRAFDDPILAALTGPGGAFEVASIEGERGPVRVFKTAPATLGDLVERGRRHGEAEFAVLDDRRLTFNGFFAWADALAAHLDKGPAGRGEPVALAMGNSLEWMAAFAGIVLSGRIPALINSRATGPDMAAAVEDAGAALVIADAKRLERLREAGCSLPAMASEGAPAAESLEAIMASGAPRQSAPMAAPDDVAALFYTSGTTGRAKAAALSHRNIVTGITNTSLARAAILRRMAEAYQVDLAIIEANMPRTCSLLMFPLFHTSGCMALFLSSLAEGGKLVMLQRWDVEEACRLVEAEKITSFPGVPTMLWDLVHSEGAKSRDLSSIVTISSGGQALPLGVLKAVTDAFPKAVIGAGYGMTETSGSVSQATGEEFMRKPEASGRLLPMVEARIVDEAGSELPLGEVGEIWVRGANVMKGYWLKGAVTGPFREGGWLATGDIGLLDEDGYITIVDRKTDMVISGGENIYCAEIEQAFSRHPDLVETAAFGAPHDRLGEMLILAAVSPRAATDKKGLIDELDAFAAQHLAGYKRPRDIVVTAERFPRNAMDKIEKHIVRQRYLKGER